MRKIVIVMLLAVCGVVMVSANTAKAVPMPTPTPWLDFGSSFSWDTSGGGSLYMDTSANVNSVTYNDGSIYDISNYFAEMFSGSFSEPVFGAPVNMSLSFDGDNTNDTLSVAGWFTADVIITNPSFDPVNAIPNPFVAMLDNITYIGPGGSQWWNEFSATFPNSGPYDAQLRLSFSGYTDNGDGTFDINGAGKVAPVPEPGTIALLGIGLAGLVGVGVRRKKAKKNVA